MRLHLTGPRYAELRVHLFDATERVAFLFTKTDGSGRDLHAVEVRLLDDRDYLRRSWHGVELAEHVRPEMIRTSHEHGYAVAEAHAHDWPGTRIRFSTTDLDGLRELGPHMTWRLPGRPYIALVFGQDSFDALVWQPNGDVTTIEALIIDGKPLHPTCLSLAQLTDLQSRSLM